MYYKKNLDFVALIWEELAYQIDNIDSKKQDKMFYPKFMKIIIHHFLEKDKSISIGETKLKDFIMQLLQELNPQNQRNLKQNLIQLSHLRKLPPRRSLPSKKDVPSKKKPASKPKPTKKKEPIKADRGKGLNVLSEVALSEAAQLKEATKWSKKDFHISQASGLGDGTNFESGVPDEQHCKTSGADEGTGTKPGVSNVPKYDFESDKESWGDSEKDDDDDEDDTEDDEGNDDYNDDDNDGHDNDANDDDNQEDDDKNDDEEDTDSDRTESDRIKIPFSISLTLEYLRRRKKKSLMMKKRWMK
ncbi:hypothetical protein Tco_0493663 [Tanacetum coccineum]